MSWGFIFADETFSNISQGFTFADEPILNFLKSREKKTFANSFFFFFFPRKKDQLIIEKPQFSFCPGKKVLFSFFGNFDVIISQIVHFFKNFVGIYFCRWPLSGFLQGLSGCGQNPQNLISPRKFIQLKQ